ncbi:hypothetical protein K32_30170 [Kaistia sp. 32K]|uniref:hypothetical protein n=1 Tax=Kaistia sp. 32K TaxID=2795690 RepID=UPI0019152484|nr:hypothetical protein [Kaistia sp. 32K]BCP54400.1 hypothetical protein K32_30170 [Kaistia sp. 32K]
MSQTIANPDVYLHVRVIIGIILGLSVSRLLSGLARFAQHPLRNPVFITHLLWVAFAFLCVVHFWWFEFYLTSVHLWTFELYIFIIFYASLYFVLCAILFPDSLAEYSGYADYFMSRRKWFYGLIAVIFLVDLVDTAIKGSAHFQSFGIIYPIRNIVYATVAIVAMFVSDKRFHLTIAILALGFQTFWILRAFSTLQ